MSTFDDKDKKFQDKIYTSLLQRQRICQNSDIGRAYLQAMQEDRTNPCVTITRDDIAKETGREKVRDVVLTEYAKAMRSQFVEVTEDLEAKTLRVCISPIRSPKIEFDSLDSLLQKNQEDLAKDPSLDDHPF